MLAIASNPAADKSMQSTVAASCQLHPASCNVLRVVYAKENDDTLVTIKDTQQQIEFEPGTT
jgi:hypothetical protein